MTDFSKSGIPAEFPDLEERIMRGLVPGWSHVRKFGAALSIGTSPVVIATAQTYRTPTTAQALEILSSDANDTAEGSGARTVTVIGLGSDWREQSETISMNGTSAVDLANTYTRVYRMYVATSGTYATASASSHAGTITLRADGGGDTWANIILQGGIGTGQSQIAAYTIPSGKRGYIMGKSVTVETTKAINLQLFRREAASTVSAPYSAMRILELDRGALSSATKLYPVPLGPFTGPCDIGFFAAATASTASVSIDFSILLEDVA